MNLDYSLLKLPYCNLFHRLVVMLNSSSILSSHSCRAKTTKIEQKEYSIDSQKTFAAHGLLQQWACNRSNNLQIGLYYRLAYEQKIIQLHGACRMSHDKNLNNWKLSILCKYWNIHTIIMLFLNAVFLGKIFKENSYKVMFFAVFSLIIHSTLIHSPNGIFDKLLLSY